MPLGTLVQQLPPLLSLQSFSRASLSAALLRQCRSDAEELHRCQLLVDRFDARLEGEKSRWFSQRECLTAEYLTLYRLSRGMKADLARSEELQKMGGVDLKARMVENRLLQERLATSEREVAVSWAECLVLRDELERTRAGSFDMASFEKLRGYSDIYLDMFCLGFEVVTSFFVNQGMLSEEQILSIHPLDALSAPRLPEPRLEFTEAFRDKLHRYPPG